LDKTKNIGSDNLAKIFTVYKDLSKDWLIMDEGEMIIKSNEPWNYHLFKETFPVQEPKGEYNLQEDKCTSCKEKDKTILAQQVTIEALQQTSKVQNELIDDLKEKISALSSKSEQ